MPSQTMAEWLQSLSIPWLVAEENGRADVTSYGTVIDDQIDLVREGVKARMPLEAPSDALPHIGGDRIILQGTESDADYAIRLQYAWEAWSRAGTPLGILEQFYWQGWDTIRIVQQNGAMFWLGDTLTPDGDPTDALRYTLTDADLRHPEYNPAAEILITIVTPGNLGVMEFTVTINDVSSDPQYTETGDVYNFPLLGGNDWTFKSIPTWIQFLDGIYVDNSTYTIATDGTITRGGGAIDKVSQSSAPWWTFGVPVRHQGTGTGQIMPFGTMSAPHYVTIRIDTSGDSATADWSYSVDGAAYVAASSSIERNLGGLVDVNVELGEGDFVAGDHYTWQTPYNTDEVCSRFAIIFPNTFGVPTDQERATMRQIIETWRRGVATCVGVYALDDGEMWGYPLGPWDTGIAADWGPSTVTRIL